MMFNYPYSRYFYNNNYYRYNNNYNMQNKKNNNMLVELPKKIQEERKEDNDNRLINSHKKNEDDCIDIFGIKLHFDDILLMLIIYFLYSEGIKDNYLFFVLILLLLT